MINYLIKTVLGALARDAAREALRKARRRPRKW
jgi:hypothetical protein